MLSWHCAFTQKLPLELRREIYELVLRDEPAARHAVKTNISFAVFNVPLFRVSRMVAKESQEIFFETNKIHIRPDQLQDLFVRHGRHLRWIHVESGSAETGLLLTEYFDAIETLTRYSKRTLKLKSVTFECQGLDITVRQLVQHLVKMHYGELLGLCIDKLQCVGVGLYTMQVAKISQQWRFSYSLLAELWNPSSRQEADCMPSFQDMEQYFSSRGPVRIPPWVYDPPQIRSVRMKLHNLQGLASLLSRYHDLEKTLPSLKPQGAQLEVLRRFEIIGNWKIKELVRHSCIEFAGCVFLGDVRAEHGSSALEWATELVAPNMKDFAAEFDTSIEDAEEYVKGCKSW